LVRVRRAVAGGQINTVADEAYGIALNATTGNARVIPYAAAYGGSVLVSYSAGYAGYGPFAIDALNIRLWTAGSERMRIDNSGNVGIGTSSPSQTLQVQGRIALGNVATHGFVNSSDLPLISASGSSGGLGFNGHLLLQPRTSAAGAVIVATGNGTATERMRIDASGNVGIGTSSPGYKLDVAGTVNTSQAVRFGASHYEGASAYAISRYLTNMVFGVPSGSGFAWGIAGGDTMILNSSGNLGIGTSSPDAKLDILGASGDQLRLRTAETEEYRIGRSTSTGFLDFYGSQTGYTGFVFTGIDGERMRIDSSGNVGIGTSSPTAGYRLQITAGTSAAMISSTTTSAGAIPKLTFLHAGNDEFSIVGGSYLGFLSSGTTERMRIASDGRTLIGTSTSPTGTAVSLTLARAGDNGVNLAYNSGAGGGASLGTITGAGLAFYTYTGVVGSESYSERMRIDSSGNLLVGKSSLADEVTTDGAIFYKNASGGGMTAYVTNGGTGSALAVSTQADVGAVIFFRSGTQVGSISVTASATAYNTSSDYRLKEIDGPIANSGAYIDALNPVQGSWKADGSRFIGLLAHEVQEVSETSVATGVKDGEEMQAMDYSAPELIANLIAEVQSLRARVAQLEGN
jgi:hypothetical protein